MARSTRPRFSRNERIRLKERIADLLAHKRTYREIGTELGIAHTTVAYYVAKLEEEWRANYLRDTDRKMVEELNRLRAIERQAWEAWFKSIEDFTETSTKTSGIERKPTAPVIEADLDGQVTVIQPGEEPDRPRMKAVETTVRGHRALGNPAYLQVILRCIEARCRLEGLTVEIHVDMSVKEAAERAAAFLGRPVEEVLAKAEEIARRAWGDGG